MMRQNPVVFFVEGATDAIDDFGAVGVRHVPLATGPEDCDTRVSCFHLAAGARITEIPTCKDSVFLVVQGRGPSVDRNPAGNLNTGTHHGAGLAR